MNCWDFACSVAKGTKKFGSAAPVHRMLTDKWGRIKRDAQYSNKTRDEKRALLGDFAVKWWTDKDFVVVDSPPIGNWDEYDPAAWQEAAAQASVAIQLAWNDHRNEYKDFHAIVRTFSGQWFSKWGSRDTFVSLLKDDFNFKMFETDSCTYKHVAFFKYKDRHDFYVHSFERGYMGDVPQAMGGAEVDDDEEEEDEDAPWLAHAHPALELLGDHPTARTHRRLLKENHRLRTVLRNMLDAAVGKPRPVRATEKRTGSAPTRASKAKMKPRGGARAPGVEPSPSELASWLHHEMGLGQYPPCFAARGLCKVLTLAMMDDGDLADLGVHDRVHSKVLLRAAKANKDRS